jgi:aminoglycoside phosphotransferase (APT) family kinase protein
MAAERTPRDFLGALGLPPDAHLEPAWGGASGDAWRVDARGETYLLRRSGSEPLTESRVAAMAAARDAGLPAPDLVARTEGAVLLTWLPGSQMLEVIARSPSSVRHWGVRAGELQRVLHAVTAPTRVTSVRSDTGFPFRAGLSVDGLPDADSLLHLDWHPMNLLVDEGRGAISGIVDWDNARRGHALLDIARTEAILTLEPGLDTLPHAVRRSLPEFLSAWASGYGPLAAEIPVACRRWAARVMLADLERRHLQRPEALDHLRAIALG